MRIEMSERVAAACGVALFDLLDTSVDRTAKRAVRTLRPRRERDRHVSDEEMDVRALAMQVLA